MFTPIARPATALIRVSLAGAHLEEIPVRNQKALASDNINDAGGIDPKKAAEALSAYRENRQVRIDGELAERGIAPDGSAIEPQPAQPQAPELQAPAPVEPPEAAAARQAAIEQAAQAAAVHAQAAQHLLKQAYAGALQEFADIRSEADLVAMAQNEPGRFARFQLAQRQIATGLSEVQGHQQRQAQEFQNFAASEDSKFLARHPEMRDPVTFNRTANDVLSVLEKSYGIDRQSFAREWSSNPVLRSAEMQSVLLDVLHFHKAKAQAAKPAPRPIPRVQRPGMAAPTGAEYADEIDDLNSRLREKGNVRDAAKLLIARRAARG